MIVILCEKDSVNLIVHRFEEINEHHLESSQKCQYSTQAVSQWLSFRLQMVGVVIVSSVGLMGIFQHHYGTADPGKFF
jgi:hypothetical protein